MNHPLPSSEAASRARFGLRQQAIAGAALMAVSLVAVTALTQWLHCQLSSIAHQALEIDAPCASAANEAVAAVARCRQYDTVFEAAWDQPETRSEALASWETAFAALERALQQIGSRLAGHTDGDRVERWQEQARQYGDGFRRAACQVDQGNADWRARATDCLAECRQQAEGLGRELESFALDWSQQAGMSGSRLQEVVARRARLINARTVVALMVVGLFFLWLHRAVLSRVGVVGDAVRRIAAGDWKVRLESRGHDELDLLAGQCNRLAAAVRASHEQLEQAKAAGQSASRAQSEFLASISEEIGRPIKVSLGYTEMLLGALRNTENLETAATIKRNHEYVLEVLDDLRDLAWIESGRLQVRPSPCSPHRIVAEVASATRVRADAKGLALGTDFRGPIPEQVLTDPGRVRQILLNLVGNAIKFTEIGTIRLTTQLLEAQGPPRLRFQVIDTGIGMAPHQLNRLFQPLPPNQSHGDSDLPATGLGLTLCKRLAEMLGGTLDADSTPGCGSTFTLVIPTGPLDGVRMVGDSREAIQRHEEHAAAPKPPARLDCRVLLAEDGRENRRLISFVLEKAGAKVEMAEDGKQALEKALAAMEALAAGRDAEAFDVVLMDMQMPVLDGYDAARRLRQAGYAGPIIAVTGHTRDYDRQRCIEAGCNDYLAKPVEREALLAMVARHARTPAARARG